MHFGSKSLGFLYNSNKSTVKLAERSESIKNKTNVLRSPTVFPTGLQFSDAFEKTQVRKHWWRQVLWTSNKREVLYAWLMQSLGLWSKRILL